MIRAFLAAAALVLALPSASPARNLDFQRYVHGEVRRDSYTFFCIEEKGAREIVGLINSYANGKTSAKDAGAAIKEKTFEYKCNRQDLLHMSLKTIIKGKISDLETVDNKSVWITKDASLVKAQARDGLIVYVITNALVPPPASEERPAGKKAPENAGGENSPREKPAESGVPRPEGTITETARAIDTSPETPPAVEATPSKTEGQSREAPAAAPEPSSEESAFEAIQAKENIPQTEAATAEERKSTEPSSQTGGQSENSLLSQQSGQDTKNIKTARASASESADNAPPAQAPKESPKTATISADAPANTDVSALQKTVYAPVTDAEMGKVIQHILDDEAKRDNRPPRPPGVIGANITDEKLEKAIQKILKEEDREAREAPPLPEVEETGSDEGEKSVASAGPSPASADIKKGQAIKPAGTGAPQPEEKARLAPEETNGRPSVIESKPAADKKPRTTPEPPNAGEDVASSPPATSPAEGSDAPESNDTLSGEEKRSGVSKESVGLPEDIPPGREAPQKEKKETGNVPADEVATDEVAKKNVGVPETEKPEGDGGKSAQNSSDADENYDEEEKEEAPPAPPNFLFREIGAAED